MTPSKEKEQSPSSSVSPRVIRLFDPHFHLWDITPTIEPEGEDDTTTISGHDGRLFFAPSGSNLYGRTEYEGEVVNGNSNDNATANACCWSGENKTTTTVVHEGGICIEADSVCFVDRPGSELTPKYRQELDWTLDQLENNNSNNTDHSQKQQESCNNNTTSGPSKKTYGFLACASLESPGIDSWLAEIASKRQQGGVPLCGIRQILNYQPSWPRNDSLGELLTDERWKRGFRLLADQNLVFDLQLNPSQFGAALAVLRETPGARVVINHAGTPTLTDLINPDKQEVYWDGLGALAECPGVVGIKISMLSYTDPIHWDTNPVVVEAVHRIIEMFGVQRVAFASNAPVDGNGNSSEEETLCWPVSRVLAAFDAMTASKYTEEERSWLFAEAAKKMYGLRT